MIECSKAKAEAGLGVGFAPCLGMCDWLFASAPLALCIGERSGVGHFGV
jgi:hypothetical protein